MNDKLVYYKNCLWEYRLGYGCELKAIFLNGNVPDCPGYAPREETAPRKDKDELCK